MAYNLMKRIIERGSYDRDDVMEKLDTFYAAGRLTTQQYNELAAMANPDAMTENGGE